MKISCWASRLVMCAIVGFFLILVEFNHPIDVQIPSLSKYVRLLGKVEVTSNENLGLCWTNSGLEFEFYGEGIKLLLKLNEGESKAALMGVWVDEEFSTYTNIDSECDEYYILQKIPRAWHKVKILKLSEYRDSSVYISGLQLLNSRSYNNIDKTVAQNKVVKFIGDSITCGNGVLAKYLDSPFDILEEDGSKSYAYYTEQTLNYDSSYYCRRGAGVAINNNGSQDNTMTNIYRNLISDGRPADIVIINLGTNDEIHIEQNQNLIPIFKGQYKKLLEKVRLNNHTAHIYVFYGVMRNGISCIIRDTVNEFAQETKDAFIYYHQYKNSIFYIDNGVSAGHPSMRAHEIFAQETLDMIGSF